MGSVRRMYWLHAITPLHVGAGRGVGFIELPVMREKVTGWPLVPGSAVKGVMRDDIGNNGSEEQKDLLNVAFGRADEDGESANSGSLVFTDARLVCLPVRSFYGTFAWVVSPMSLHRLMRDFDIEGTVEDINPASEADNQRLLCPRGIETVIKDSDDKVYFEDLNYLAEESANAATWAQRIASWVFPSDSKWEREFKKRFAIIPDDSFNFLCEHGTEVNARIRIDQETKTVRSGALWYEESLPAETMLAGLVVCDRMFGSNKGGMEPDNLVAKFCSEELQLQMGGKATVGKGRVRCLFSKSGKS
jgi:CRISPR-associated protein Cmr4